MIFSTDKNISEIGIILYDALFLCTQWWIQGTRGAPPSTHVNLGQQTQMHKTCAFLAPAASFCIPRKGKVMFSVILLTGGRVSLVSGPFL